ncbi:hypothetical protein HK098_000112 [Nowakowskiella sp. JEL0407]|nr:hypothetical protein HK098_000112 [Nowakowskiella sp. JEL0407]
MVKLLSSDGQEFVVSTQVASQAVVIKNLLEDVGEGEDIPVPLANDDPPIPENAPKKSLDDIDEWDKSFMGVDLSIIFDIILAANYLDIKNLLDVGKYSSSLRNFQLEFN